MSVNGSNTIAAVFQAYMKVTTAAAMAVGSRYCFYLLAASHLGRQHPFHSRLVDGLA